ncbi:MAG: DUF1573 domain-containing protein [Bacteroidia bacterium]
MKRYTAMLGLLLFTIVAMAQSSIELVDTRHDFGTIQEDGGKVSYVFGFKNVGDKPLKIETVKTPCGCTSPTWTQSEIPVGGGGYVEATFDPLHRPGVFNKVLTVVTNGNPRSAYIKIVGEVLPRKRTVEDHFPMVRGNLRYQMPQIFMGKVRTGIIDTVHVRIYNSGMQTVSIERIDNPVHVKTNIVTKEIPPKSYGKFILSYDAIKRGELGMVTDQIIVYTNDALEPEQMIYVVAEIEQNIEVLTPKQLEEAPKIAALEEVIDLGDVTEGDEVRGVFKITNEGVNTLRLIRVKPECGCTTTSVSANQIEEGKTSKIDLIFDATGYDGLIVKTIDIFSNDPLNPKKTLKMRAYVNPKEG